MEIGDIIREGKIKRYFAARRKWTFPHFISHITQRAAGREPLFLEKSDYLFMLSLLKQIATERLLHIYAFCLLPNHMHLLCSPETEDLPDIMRDLFSHYAKRFNAKYERKGHLFGGPYRQAVCLDDTYLLSASLYIHMNPVRAGLSTTAQDYRWSSCRLYWSQEPRQSFVDNNFVLRLLAFSNHE